MIGIDVIAISRIEHAMARYGERFLEKFLSPPEIELVKNPRTAAGFWAAKEAVSKALGCGIGAELGFHDIRLSKTSKGAPMAVLRQPAAKRHGGPSLAISITHDADLAIAVAVYKE